MLPLHHGSKRGKAPFISGQYYSPLTASLNALAALNLGDTDAAISISSPVCGFLPVLAARSTVSNEPKPASATFSPLATSATIASSTYSPCIHKYISLI